MRPVSLPLMDCPTGWMLPPPPFLHIRVGCKERHHKPTMAVVGRGEYMGLPLEHFITHVGWTEIKCPML